MIPPVFSQADLDQIAADLRAHARMPAAFWFMVGLGLFGAMAFGMVAL